MRASLPVNPRRVRRSSAPQQPLHHDSSNILTNAGERTLRPASSSTPRGISDAHINSLKENRGTDDVLAQRDRNVNGSAAQTAEEEGLSTAGASREPSTSTVRALSASLLLAHPSDSHPSPSPVSAHSGRVEDQQETKQPPAEPRKLLSPAHLSDCRRVEAQVARVRHLLAQVELPLVDTHLIETYLAQALNAAPRGPLLFTHDNAAAQKGRGDVCGSSKKRSESRPASSAVQTTLEVMAAQHTTKLSSTSVAYPASRTCDGAMRASQTPPSPPPLLLEVAATAASAGTKERATGGAADASEVERGKTCKNSTVSKQSHALQTRPGLANLHVNRTTHLKRSASNPSSLNGEASRAGASDSGFASAATAERTAAADGDGDAEAGQEPSVDTPLLSLKLLKGSKHAWYYLPDEPAVTPASEEAAEKENCAALQLPTSETAGEKTSSFFLTESPVVEFTELIEQLGRSAENIIDTEAVLDAAQLSEPAVAVAVRSPRRSPRLTAPSSQPGQRTGAPPRAPTRGHTDTDSPGTAAAKTPSSPRPVLTPASTSPATKTTSPPSTTTTAALQLKSTTRTNAAAAAGGRLSPLELVLVNTENVLTQYRAALAIALRAVQHREAVWTALQHFLYVVRKDWSPLDACAGVAATPRKARECVSTRAVDGSVRAGYPTEPREDASSRSSAASSSTPDFAPEHHSNGNPNISTTVTPPPLPLQGLLRNNAAQKATGGVKVGGADLEHTAVGAAGEESAAHRLAPPLRTALRLSLDQILAQQQQQQQTSAATPPAAQLDAAHNTAPYGEQTIQNHDALHNTNTHNTSHTPPTSSSSAGLSSPQPPRTPRPPLLTPSASAAHREGSAGGARQRACSAATTLRHTRGPASPHANGGGGGVAGTAPAQSSATAAATAMKMTTAKPKGTAATPTLHRLGAPSDTAGFHHLTGEDSKRRKSVAAVEAARATQGVLPSMPRRSHSSDSTVRSIDGTAGVMMRQARLPLRRTPSAAHNPRTEEEEKAQRVENTKSNTRSTNDKDSNNSLNKKGVHNITPLSSARGTSSLHRSQSVPRVPPVALLSPRPPSGRAAAVTPRARILSRDTRRDAAQKSHDGAARVGLAGGEDVCADVGRQPCTTSEPGRNSRSLAAARQRGLQQPFTPSVHHTTTNTFTTSITTVAAASQSSEAHDAARGVGEVASTASPSAHLHDGVISLEARLRAVPRRVYANCLYHYLFYLQRTTLAVLESVAELRAQHLQHAAPFIVEHRNYLLEIVTQTAALANDAVVQWLLHEDGVRAEKGRAERRGAAGTPRDGTPQPSYKHNNRKNNSSNIDAVRYESAHTPLRPAGTDGAGAAASPSSSPTPHHSRQQRQPSSHHHHPSPHQSQAQYTPLKSSRASGSDSSALHSAPRSSSHPTAEAEQAAETAAHHAVQLAAVQGRWPEQLLRRPLLSSHPSLAPFALTPTLLLRLSTPSQGDAATPSAGVQEAHSVGEQRTSEWAVRAPSELVAVRTPAKASGAVTGEESSGDSKEKEDMREGTHLSAELLRLPAAVLALYGNVTSEMDDVQDCDGGKGVDSCIQEERINDSDGNDLHVSGAPRTAHTPNGFLAAATPEATTSVDELSARLTEVQRHHKSPSGISISRATRRLSRPSSAAVVPLKPLPTAFQKRLERSEAMLHHEVAVALSYLQLCMQAALRREYPLYLRGMAAVHGDYLAVSEKSLLQGRRSGSKARRRSSSALSSSLTLLTAPYEAKSKAADTAQAKSSRAAVAAVAGEDTRRHNGDSCEVVALSDEALRGSWMEELKVSWQLLMSGSSSVE